MKTLLHMEMYYVIEYTPTCRFPVRVEFIIFNNLQLECILHYIGTKSEKVAEVQK